MDEFTAQDKDDRPDYRLNKVGSEGDKSGCRDENDIHRKVNASDSADSRAANQVDDSDRSDRMNENCAEDRGSANG